MSRQAAKITVTVLGRECRRLELDLDEVKKTVRTMMDNAKGVVDGGEGTCGDDWDCDVHFENDELADILWGQLETYMENTFGTDRYSDVAWVDLMDIDEYGC